MKTAAVLAGLLVVVGVVVFASGDDEEVAVEPTPTPTPKTTPPPAEPFDLQFDREVGGQWLGNEQIYGDDPPPVEPELLERHAQGAADRLEAFLNAIFVDLDTRFSPEAVDVLFHEQTRPLVTEEHEEGLGTIDVGAVARTETGSASARATVFLVREDRPRMVALRYTATMTAILEDGETVPITQQGTALFAPTRQGWVARSVDVTTTTEEG